MKKLQRSEMKNLKGGLFAPPGGGLGCPTRPSSAKDCTCVGQDTGWCYAQTNGPNQCQCVNAAGTECYVYGMSSGCSL